MANGWAFGPWSLPLKTCISCRSIVVQWNHVEQSSIDVSQLSISRRKVLVLGSWKTDESILCFSSSKKIESIDILKVRTPLWHACCSERQHLARLFPLIQDTLKTWYVAKNMKRTWNEVGTKVKEAASDPWNTPTWNGTYCYCHCHSLCRKIIDRTVECLFLGRVKPPTRYRWWIHVQKSTDGNKVQMF